MSITERFADTRDNVKHFYGRVKSRSLLLSLIPEIFKKDFQKRKISQGAKMEVLCGCQAWKGTSVEDFNKKRK